MINRTEEKKTYSDSNILLNNPLQSFNPQILGKTKGQEKKYWSYKYFVSKTLYRYSSKQKLKFLWTSFIRIFLIKKKNTIHDYCTCKVIIIKFLRQFVQNPGMKYKNNYNNQVLHSKF